MNKSLMLEGIDRQELAECIASAVVASMRPILVEVSKAVPATPERRLVDATEMARLLATSESTLARLVANGSIPSSKVGSSRRFDPGAVMDAIAVATEDRRETLLSQLLAECVDDAERDRVRAAMGAEK